MTHMYTEAKMKPVTVHANLKNSNFFYQLYATFAKAHQLLNPSHCTRIEKILEKPTDPSGITNASSSVSCPHSPLTSCPFSLALAALPLRSTVT